jgi:hypothetical protein
VLVPFSAFREEEVADLVEEAEVARALSRNFFRVEEPEDIDPIVDRRKYLTKLYSD